MTTGPNLGCDQHILLICKMFNMKPNDTKYIQNNENVKKVYVG